MSQSTINHFEITLKMLNESMGMCLPTSLIMVDGLPEDGAWPQEDGSDMESTPQTTTRDIISSGSKRLSNTNWSGDTAASKNF